MKKIAVIIGARPQFIKHAPVELALRNYFEVITIHTGQHYDSNMSDVFFNELNIANPKYMLNIGSYTQGKQTGLMIEKIEETLLKETPVALLVYGDTNSTLAGAIAASKLNIPIIHIEAGLRSFNKSMPEEVNRVLTDHISSMLFAPTQSAIKNLSNENIKENVFNVGDVMFDSLLLALNALKESSLKNKNFVLCTLHRPYNTDEINRLLNILNVLNKLSYTVYFPVHPRTLHILKRYNIETANFKNIKFIEPVSYFELIKLQKESKCVITDSGGVQKEAYMLRKKCITLRTETEWVETLINGWNTLIYDNLQDIARVIEESPRGYIPDLYGNGKAALQMAKIISTSYN